MVMSRPWPAPHLEMSLDARQAFAMIPTRKLTAANLTGRIRVCVGPSVKAGNRGARLKADRPFSASLRLLRSFFRRPILAVENDDGTLKL